MSLKNEQGFTLVELMVVVAIIGLLSAVAVPNFKKYQARSRTTEAKLQLAAVYTAQQAFYAQYNMYAGCLNYMGYNPDEERANRYYAIGFFSVNGRNSLIEVSAINSGLNVSECTAGTIEFNSSGGNRGLYYAGKGVGNMIINDQNKFNENTAGMKPNVCTNTSMGGSSGFGACVGSQEDDENMTFQVGAVGIISKYKMTGATASGFNINHNKIIKNPQNGY